MENYFNYFTEIEERYLQRRGSGLLLSTLDWALIETWKEAGIPVEAALAGIAATFDKYDRRPRKTRKINSLAYCAQEVLAAAEDMKEAAVGVQRAQPQTAPGLSAEEIAGFLRGNAQALLHIVAPADSDSRTAAQGEKRTMIQTLARECSDTLSEMAAEIERQTAAPRLEDLERRLTVLEERLLAALTMATAENELVTLRAEADREIRPYRSKMPGLQIEQLQKQFVHKRLFEKAKIPRLSLFYL